MMGYLLLIFVLELIQNSMHSDITRYSDDKSQITGAASPDPAEARLR